MKFKCILAEAGVPNKNKVVFTKEVLEKSVADYQEKIKKNQSFGHLDTPQGSTLTLSKVSHIVKSLEMQDDKVVAEVETIGTPNGEILNYLINNDAKLEFIPSFEMYRGCGSMNEKGELVVSNDMKLNYINISMECKCES